MDPTKPNSPGPQLVPGPQPDRRRLLIIAASIVATILIVVATVLLTKPKSASNSKTASSPSITPQIVVPHDPSSDPAHPGDDVLAVVAQYVQARENGGGADQRTDTSWIANVQSISTPFWYGQLQPAPGGTTGGYGEFRIAHQNNYVVKTHLNKCIWDIEAATPTATGGVIYCELTDDTINRSNGAVISAESLPAGWTRTGAQYAVKLKMVKSGTTWLIDDDESGEGDLNPIDQPSTSN